MALDNSIDDILTRMIFNAHLPKFQLERASEVFISLFLEEWLSEELQGKVEIIVQEFPFKKELNNQSTNVDYLMSQNDSKLLFVELKTNKVLSKPQLQSYQNLPTHWRTLYTNIEQISKNTKEKSKYNFLLKQIEPYKNISNAPEVIYVTPHLVKPESLKGFKWFSLQSMFTSFSSKNNSELWEKVKTLSEVIK